MSKLVEEILNKNYDVANEVLEEQFRTILERKMCEMKKIVAAEMYSQTDEKLKSVSKLYRGVNEEEAGEESSMARSELSAIVKDAKSIMSKVKGNKELEAWTQSKITKSADYMNAVADYMDNEGKLDEARINIVKARIRGGVLQRRKKVSNVPGMTIRGGQLKRMSAAERRRRKLGAKKAQLKTRGKQVQIQRNRKLSLMKRKRLGL
jgi:L-cysteine desulfidase